MGQVPTDVGRVMPIVTKAKLGYQTPSSLDLAREIRVLN